MHKVHNYKVHNSHHHHHHHQKTNKKKWEEQEHTWEWSWEEDDGMSSAAAASSASPAALALLFSHQVSSAGLPSKHHLSICLSISTCKTENVWLDALLLIRVEIEAKECFFFPLLHTQYLGQRTTCIPRRIPVSTAGVPMIRLLQAPLWCSCHLWCFSTAIVAWETSAATISSRE